MGLIIKGDNIPLSEIQKMRENGEIPTPGVGSGISESTIKSVEDVVRAINMIANTKPEEINE